MATDRRRDVVVTAVLPAYRAGFLAHLASLRRVDFFSGSEHCDPSVRTAVPTSAYQEVRNVFFARRKLFMQWGAHLPGWQAETCVVDLNPRSITAWALLLSRKIARRRILVWGHVLPRAGAEARTKPLRDLMQRLSDGVITYTWSDRELSRAKLPGKAVWTASNALYGRADLAQVPLSRERDAFLYVGRLEAEKKPRLLLDAFALAKSQGMLPAGTRLVFVGHGAVVDELLLRVRELQFEDCVSIAPAEYSFDGLAALYSTAIAAVSPGYAGLQITQSHGFGVPIVVARGETHAPEIELATGRGATWFDKDDPESLAAALSEIAGEPLSFEEADGLRSIVAERYSTDSMATGFAAALAGLEVR